MVDLRQVIERIAGSERVDFAGWPVTTKPAGVPAGPPPVERVEGADAADRVVAGSIVEEADLGVLPVAQLPMGRGHLLDQANLFGSLRPVGTQQ